MTTVGRPVGRPPTPSRSTPAKDSYKEHDDQADGGVDPRRLQTLLRPVRASASCIGCHADYGRQVPFRYDDWGTLVRPMNLTHRRLPRRPPAHRPLLAHQGRHRPVRHAADRRDATTRTIWDVVNFVQALPYPQMLPEDVRNKVYDTAAGGERPRKRSAAERVKRRIATLPRFGGPRRRAEGLPRSVVVQKLWGLSFRRWCWRAIFALCVVVAVRRLVAAAERLQLRRRRGQPLLHHPRHHRRRLRPDRGPPRLVHVAATPTARGRKAALRRRQPPPGTHLDHRPPRVVLLYIAFAQVSVWERIKYPGADAGSRTRSCR